MELPLIPGAEPSAGAVVENRGRGRPKGSTSKRSADLVRYIEARYAGLTPGQVSAELGLVTARELRRAKGDLVKALAEKARTLASELGLKTAEAWELMRRERAELMPYVHQKRPQSVELEGKGAILPMVVIGAAGPGPLDGAIDGEWTEGEQDQALNRIGPA